jgi:hypothetical protein
VDQWQPGGYLYPRLQSIIKGLGKNGARAVLWHQGESDTGGGTNAQTYLNKLSAIINQSRVDATYNLNWVVAKASYVSAAYSYFQGPIRQAQTQIVNNTNIFAGPDTDDMLGAYRSADGIHFSDSGLKEHGRRWAEILKTVPVP